MQFLLLYLGMAIALGLRAGATGRTPRAWMIGIGAVALGLGFTSLRVIG